MDARHKDSDAATAFIANRQAGKTLSQSAEEWVGMKWEECLEKCQKEMQEKENLARCINQSVPKNKG